MFVLVGYLLILVYVCSPVIGTMSDVDRLIYKNYKSFSNHIYTRINIKAEMPNKKYRLLCVTLQINKLQ